MEFEEFAKIPRLKTRIVITEKIDGTNAQVAIEGPLVSGDISEATLPTAESKIIAFEAVDGLTYSLRAGSRSRWIIPGDDNFGFAHWVKTNATELVKLGPGRHYGEWWGSGIQRGYGKTNGDKTFSLFNSLRWNADNPNRPTCCSVVPVLFDGENPDVPEIMQQLLDHGSYAAPGFMKPEGIILYYTGAKDRGIFKETFEHKQGKWASQLKEQAAAA